MIDFAFKYKKKETVIKGRVEEKMIDLCKKFASFNEGIIPQTKVYIYEGKKLNLKIHLPNKQNQFSQMKK